MAAERKSVRSTSKPGWSSAISRTGDEGATDQGTVSLMTALRNPCGAVLEETSCIRERKRRADDRAYDLINNGVRVVFGGEDGSLSGTS